MEEDFQLFEDQNQTLNDQNNSKNNNIFNQPDDLEKNYQELLETINWDEDGALTKAMEIMFKQFKSEDPMPEKVLSSQAPIQMCENAKKIMESMYNLIKEIHEDMTIHQYERFNEMEEKLRKEMKEHLSLDQLDYETRKEYMKQETKYSLFQSDYSVYLEKIFKTFFNTAMKYGQFFNDTQLLMKSKQRVGEIISRHCYYSLRTGKMEKANKFYKPEIKYGEPTLREGQNGYMELKDYAIKMKKQGTTDTHRTEKEKREKLVNDINKHEEFTRNLIEKLELTDFAEGKDLNKSHDWKIKDSEMFVYRDLESWFNDLMIYQELSLGVGEVMKYQYIKNYEKNKSLIDRYIMEKKTGSTHFKENDPDTYARIERYVERAKFDPYIGGVFEGISVEELREPKYAMCIAKELGDSKWKILIRLSESTWQIDKRRIQFKLINEEQNIISKTYMVKYSDIEKKIFDIDSLLNMMIKIPIDSFAYLMLQNYVLKPTDEKETWMGLDHFMSTPLKLKNQFIKTKQLLKNGKYSVHRNTSDVEFFILSILTCAQKCMEFNHLAVLFKPRKRQGNVKQLVECFEAFGVKRFEKPKRQYIRFLIKKIRSGYYDKEFDFKSIRDDLNAMNEVSADQLMGTSASNHMEIDKYFTSKYAKVIAASGKYHSMKTAETVAEILNEDFSHLKLNEILSKLNEACLVRIFIKEMMGGMRDIAILSPQWKVACAILEEIAKRVSVNSAHDLIQKEKLKAELITKKIKKLEQRFIKAYGHKGRLIVLELDYSKWNAHQWTDILGEITAELVNKAFGYKTSAGEYLKTASYAYTSKMMQVELKRLGSSIYAHLSLIKNKSLLRLLDLTEEEERAIEKMNANPTLARQEYTGDQMQEWIEDALECINEVHTGNDSIKLSDLIIMVRCPHGMGQGIFSTQSSIFGTMVLSPILEVMMKAFNVTFYDFVETSDDGNIYMMVPKNHRLIQPDVQSVFVDELNSQVNNFGLELSVGKVKWDINGSFCFNSSDYDTTSVEYLSGLPAKVECLNRLWKGFGSLQYESPFIQFLRNSTWLIFLKNSYKINQKQMSEIAKWMKQVRDHVLRNNLTLNGLSPDQTEFLYCTVPSLEMNGEIFFTNRKEVEMLLAMSVKNGKEIDLNYVENLMRESTSAIGFTFKNPKFDVQRKFSESQDMLIARESGFDGQVKMLTHLGKMKGSCDTFASYYRVLASPWIDKDGMKVQMRMSNNRNGLLSNYAISLTNYDHSNWDHQYGFFVEDNDTSKESNKKMSAELFKAIYTRRVSEGEESELLINTLNALEGIDNDYMVKNLSSFIVPLGKNTFKGQHALPSKGQTLKDYILKMEYADPWLLPQNRKGRAWANYGVLILEADESTAKNPIFKLFVVQDDHVIGIYKVEDKRMLNWNYELPSPLCKYTIDISQEISDNVLSSIWEGNCWLVERLSSNFVNFDHVKMRKARLLMSDKWNMYERHYILSGKGVEYTVLKRAIDSSEDSTN